MPQAYHFRNEKVETCKCENRTRAIAKTTHTHIHTERKREGTRWVKRWRVCVYETVFAKSKQNELERKRQRERANEERSSIVFRIGTLDCLEARVRRWARVRPACVQEREREKERKTKREKTNVCVCGFYFGKIYKYIGMRCGISL